MAKKATRKSTAKKTKKKTKKTGVAKTGTKKKTVPKKTTKTASTKKTKKKGPSALGIRSQHVDFLTYKVDQLRKFYHEILEIPAETRDSDGLNYLLVETSEGSTIGFMPPHPEMRGEQPQPREPTLYFVVKDVERAYAQLIAKGVAFLGPPQEMPWGHQVVATTDPEGRTVMLASKIKKRKSK